MALWGGRFSDNTDEMVLALSESVSFDCRLYAQDIRGSIAHVRMLGRTGIIPVADADAIVAELEVIRGEIATGDFAFDTALEDIHMNSESRLIAALGDTGARLHSARSRNDQVATDLRLYVREQVDAFDELLAALQAALVEVATENHGAILPGLTHLQNAQPVLLSHHLLAYTEMVGRDRGRLADCRARLNELPLGAGALAGSTLPIDRESVAEELGFDRVMRNSLDAVSDRDFVIEMTAALALVMMHLSRLSEDLIFWMSQACGYIQLGDRFCTGSSLMPQKKNPDVAELTRGKTARVYGDLTALLTLMKGLPLAYNRDMQEDKEALFDAIDTTKLVLAVYAPMLRTLKADAAAMAAAAADPALMATDLAEWLVGAGVPFRTAHERVGNLVRYCQDQDLAMDALSLEQMQSVIPEATDACLSLFSAEASVAARTATGGTAPAQVTRQLAYWRERLAAAGHGG
jgi:argininosuccinate lyase